MSKISGSKPFLPVTIPIPKYKIPPTRSPQTTALSPAILIKYVAKYKLQLRLRCYKLPPALFLFPEQTANKWPEEVHSKPPNANILSTKIISGGLIVRTITTIPNIIVITVLIDLTFFSYDLFFQDHLLQHNSSINPLQLRLWQESKRISRRHYCSIGAARKIAATPVGIIF